MKKHKMLPKKERRKILKALARIRGQNNILWMALVEIALENPKANKIFQKIKKLDKKINKWMDKI